MAVKKARFKIMVGKTQISKHYTKTNAAKAARKIKGSKRIVSIGSKTTRKKKRRSYKSRY